MQSGTSQPLRSRRILVVEDCPDDQRLLARILSRAGGEVSLECSGESAIEHIRHVAGTGRGFDLVVMDLQMPGMDGIETTRRLRESGYIVPILAVTACGNEDTEMEWKSAGCFSYLAKPVRPDTLVSRACQALLAVEV
jgi:CheY-like chemotaxis protein